MFFVVLDYRHPGGEQPAVSITLLAERVDICRDSLLVFSEGEQHVLDVPASGRDEAICTALGRPFLWSISIEQQPPRSSHPRGWTSREDATTRSRAGDFDTRCPVLPGSEDVG
jgi:hypothetical protein